MKNIANKLINNYGFNFLLTMHIIRYSKEKKLTIHEIIQKFKKNSIDLGYMAYISYSGYDSFKRIYEALA